MVVALRTTWSYSEERKVRDVRATGRLEDIADNLHEYAEEAISQLLGFVGTHALAQMRKQSALLHWPIYQERGKKSKNSIKSWKLDKDHKGKFEVLLYNDAPYALAVNNKRTIEIRADDWKKDNKKYTNKPNPNYRISQRIIRKYWNAITRKAARDFNKEVEAGRVVRESQFEGSFDAIESAPQDF